MKHYKLLLPRIIIRVFVTLIITLSLIAGFLYYKQSFTSVVYSDWIFVTSLLYIIIGFIPAYSVITTSNEFSIKFGEHMVNGHIDARDRVIDSYRKFDSIFPIVLVVTGLLCMGTSALISILYK